MRAFYARRLQEDGISYNVDYQKKYRERDRALVAAGQRLTKRQLYPESYRAADQRRRARKMGATCENFTAREVYERDRWVCWICHELVVETLRYPNPRSASLDHLVPLSHGGEHTRANTRCSHLECNVRRQAPVFDPFEIDWPTP